jgi:YD repeat-containing protein
MSFFLNNACIVLKILYNCLHGVQQREGNKSMKNLTNEEIALIPMGYTWDAKGNILTYKDSHGVWRECTRDAMGNELTFKNSHGVWREYTRDAMGNILTYKDSYGVCREYTWDAMGNELTCKNSDGVWYEYTRDAMGKVLTYKDSHGVWREYTRDAKGNILTYKDNHGVWREYTWDAMGKVLTYKDIHGVWTKIAESNYTLYVDGYKVWAGCQHFDSIEEALKHWNREDERAKIFTKALKKYQEKSNAQHQK